MRFSPKENLTAFFGKRKETYNRYRRSHSHRYFWTSFYRVLKELEEVRGTRLSKRILSSLLTVRTRN